VALTLLSGEQIETTETHPFCVEGRGWVQAGQLGIGTQILARAGPGLWIACIERRWQAARVFNFEVEGAHCYFVGSSGGGLCVHNWPCGPEQEARAISKIQNAISKNARLGPNGEVVVAIKDLLGNPVPKPGAVGQYYDHLQELDQAMRGLEKNAALLEDSTNPAAQAAREQALEHLDRIWGRLGTGLYP
jgi:hypothetical protein